MLVQFKRTFYWWETQRTHKCGEVIDIDRDQYKELFLKGIVEDYSKAAENEKAKIVKTLSKMNKEELLDFAKEKNITILYENEDLIRQSIKIALLYRGENND